MKCFLILFENSEYNVTLYYALWVFFFFPTLIFHNVLSDILLLVIAYSFESMRIRYGKYIVAWFFFFPFPYSIRRFNEEIILSSQTHKAQQTTVKLVKREKGVDPKRIGLIDIDIDINKLLFIYLLFAISIINRIRLFKICYYSSGFRFVFDYQRLQG